MAPTPVLLPGESHGQRSLVGYSPWGCKESDTTERLCSLTAPLQALSYLPVLRAGPTAPVNVGGCPLCSGGTGAVEGQKLAVVHGFRVNPGRGALEATSTTLTGLF